MIRKAKTEDIGRIMKMVEEAIILMNEEDNTQWDENYPLASDFIADIEEETLYVFDDGEVKGVVCINQTQPFEYKNVTWQVEKEAIVIHRMAVLGECRRQGIAKKFMEFAEEKARELGTNYIRTDTNSKNTRMNAMFQKLGYEKTGIVHFRNNPYDFYCYEKEIGN